MAATVTAMPAVAPTERSSPPTTIVMVRPRPAMPTTDVNFSIENIVDDCRNAGIVAAK